MGGTSANMDRRKVRTPF